MQTETHDDLSTFRVQNYILNQIAVMYIKNISVLIYQSNDIKMVQLLPGNVFFKYTSFGKQKV